MGVGGQGSGLRIIVESQSRSLDIVINYGTVGTGLRGIGGREERQVQIGTLVDPDVLWQEAAAQRAMYPLQRVGAVGIGHVHVVAVDGHLGSIAHGVVVAVETVQVEWLTLHSSGEHRGRVGARAQCRVGLAHSKPHARRVGHAKQHAGHLHGSSRKCDIVVGHLIERVAPEYKLDVEIGLSRTVGHIEHIGQAAIAYLGLKARGIAHGAVNVGDGLWRAAHKRVAIERFQLQIGIGGKQHDGIVEIHVALAVFHVAAIEIVDRAIGSTLLVDAEAAANAVGMLLAFGLDGDNVGRQLRLVGTCLEPRRSSGIGA